MNKEPPDPWGDQAKLERLKFYRDLICHEQAFYWSRFQGFAALNAGLLALVSINADGEPTALKVLGLLLAAIWVYVQWTSLWYVNRYKPEYHALREKFDVSQTSHSIHGRRRLSSTDIAFCGTVIVALIWLVSLWPELFIFSQ